MQSRTYQFLGATLTNLNDRMAYLMGGDVGMIEPCLEPSPSGKSALLLC